MAVDLIRLFTKGIWYTRALSEGIEIIAPLEVSVDVQTFEVTAEFVYEDH
jgi:hypothetical protein